MEGILFDRKILRLNQKRISNNFLHQETANRINENIELLGREFKNILKIESGNFSYKDYKIIADEEFLPFKANSFDLIISNLNFHFINQIPQFLLQIKDILQPNGLFIASFFGEENLKELRHVLYEVETEFYGAVSPRVAPTIDVKTAATLIQKAGFANPISDLDKIEIEYKSVYELLKDLKSMGQGNIMVKRSRRFFATR